MTTPPSPSAKHVTYPRRMFGEDESEQDEHDQTQKRNQSITFIGRIDHQESDQGGYKSQVNHNARSPGTFQDIVTLVMAR